MKTLSILKPDATRRNITGAINKMIEESGLKIIAQKRMHLSARQAGMFYGVHAEKPFFQELVDYMTSGPIVVQVLEGPNAVEDYRKLMGATNPQNAADGTIRKTFGESLNANAVHGSDSAENAAIEVSFFFSTCDITG